MSGIDDRGDAFENKFAHDEALKIQVGSPTQQIAWPVGCRKNG